MSSTETEYYRQRASTERAMAQKSGNANVALIYAELARQYQALADKAELRTTLRIAFPSHEPA